MCHAQARKPGTAGEHWDRSIDNHACLLGGDDGDAAKMLEVRP
jgi:hypothetical protein